MQHPRRRAALSVTADRLACALFGLANTVTAMFYAVENATQGLVEGGAIERPWWLDLSVHAANSGVAWIDLLIVEERSFSGRSRHLALGMALAYCFWLLVIRRYFSKFPYPIMNKLPFPAGYLGRGRTSGPVLARTGRPLTAGGSTEVTPSWGP